MSVEVKDCNKSSECKRTHGSQKITQHKIIYENNIKNILYYVYVYLVVDIYYQQFRSNVFKLFLYLEKRIKFYFPTDFMGHTYHVRWFVLRNESLQVEQHIECTAVNISPSYVVDTRLVLLLYNHCSYRPATVA